MFATPGEFRTFQVGKATEAAGIGPSSGDVIPKDSEGESWGLARNFKTSNGSLRMLPTSIRGRLWKLGFEGPDPTFAGFLVIPKGSEVDFQVPPVGILGIPWNIQNR